MELTPDRERDLRVSLDRAQGLGRVLAAGVVLAPGAAPAAVDQARGRGYELPHRLRVAEERRIAKRLEQARVEGVIRDPGKEPRLGRDAIAQMRALGMMPEAPRMELGLRREEGPQRGPGQTPGKELGKEFGPGLTP